MGWVFTRCVPNNFVPDKLFTGRYIMKWVREFSFHYYSYYCSPTREDADAPSQNDRDSFNENSVMSFQTCLKFFLLQNTHDGFSTLDI